ncbi:DUF202 domain-containing protein [Demequina pelophila]|uniref:DUF202 domain-containing protein n=1 Tax=Demequina pelophila TaxID=1638984 RepID=UPI0007856FE9|nr:DUF202 domain-containing protein [Demequina pelophila]
MSELFDAGMQPERTLLAWRRTCLAIGVGGAAAARYGGTVVGVPAVVAGLLGLALAGAAYLFAARRYRRAHRHLVDRGVLAHDGLPLALLAGALVALAIAGFVTLPGLAQG